MGCLYILDLIQMCAAQAMLHEYISSGNYDKLFMLKGKTKLNCLTNSELHINDIFSCRMWEIRETSSGPAGYTCEKCKWLHLLTDLIRELELELDALRIVRDAENIIDKSYSEVVIPKVQAT
eukprot:g34717.t1